MLTVIPDTHKKDLRIEQLPESLLEAIKGFLLVCAARRIRKEGVVHNSMLIHVTRFTAVQRQIKDLVEKELAQTGCQNNVRFRFAIGFQASLGK